MSNICNSNNNTIYVQRPQKQQQHLVKRHSRPPAQPFNNTDVPTMERGDVRADNGHGVGNVLDRERCAGNGLDRQHVDVVNFDRRPTSDIPPPNTSKDNKSTTATTTGTRTNNCNDNGNHKISQATQPAFWTPKTIQKIINAGAAAVGISTSGNTV